MPLTALSVSATAQAPDKLMYKGSTYSLFTNPLEPFFKEHPQKRPQAGGGTSLWRGYIATFEIRDGLFYVSDVEIRVVRPETRNLAFQSVYQSVFGAQKDVVADWFDGLLVVPLGKELQYVHMGYASLYERYMLFKIEKGRLVKEIEMTAKEYREFKQRQFEEYKKSPEYEAGMKSVEGNMGDRTSHEEFLYIYEIEYTTKYLLDF